VNLPADTASTVLTVAKAASGVKSITINNSTTLSKVITVAPGGSATATIVATATDGTIKATYTVKVKRAPVISGITVSGGSLGTVFSATTKSYTVSIPATTSTVTLTPVKASACALLTIDGVAQSSKSYSPPIGGSITATITGKTALGLTVTYTVKISRAKLITGIRTSTSTYGISPSFSATTLDYTVTIPSTRSSITIYVTKASSGVKTVTMNGSATTSLVVKPSAGGSAKVVITATATDGTTKISYTVTVKRAS
jgi:hypothetical protein